MSRIGRGAMQNSRVCRYYVVKYDSEIGRPRNCWIAWDLGRPGKGKWLRWLGM